MIKKLIVSLLLSVVSFALPNNWELGPFVRVDLEEPVLQPEKDSVFYCPVQNKPVFWESKHTFNPAAVAKDGKIFLFYRAEDDFGEGIGRHTSRIGIAVSEDGIHFERHQSPVLYPDLDDQEEHEFPGGCEDPRIVETEDGTYVMTYTQWNRNVTLLAVATSDDLFHWKKHGFAFKEYPNVKYLKSGSIVCRQVGDKLIATKVGGKYLMYWGEGRICLATSDDLITWETCKNSGGEWIEVLAPRAGYFDSSLVEAGPPAIITEQGILLLYNGKNSSENGDPLIKSGAYSPGQALFDIDHPTQLISRQEKCFLTPQCPYEMSGQYTGGTVFIEGLVPFQEQWFLYYGASDSAVGVAITEQRR